MKYLSLSKVTATPILVMGLTMVWVPSVQAATSVKVTDKFTSPSPSSPPATLPPLHTVNVWFETLSTLEVTGAQPNQSLSVSFDIIISCMGTVATMTGSVQGPQHANNQGKYTIIADLGGGKNLYSASYTATGTANFTVNGISGSGGDSVDFFATRIESADPINTLPSAP